MSVQVQEGKDQHTAMSAKHDSVASQLAAEHESVMQLESHLEKQHQVTTADFQHLVSVCACRLGYMQP